VTAQGGLRRQEGDELNCAASSNHRAGGCESFGDIATAGTSCRRLDRRKNTQRTTKETPDKCMMKENQIHIHLLVRCFRKKNEKKPQRLRRQISKLKRTAADGGHSVKSLPADSKKIVRDGAENYH